MSRPLNVVLGVTGGIAAIKSPEVVRRLRERGHAVRCVLTHGAASFVAALPLEVLSGGPVYREEYLAANDSGRELHIEIARWADVICIAPATCNTLARLALGLADDFLTTTVLAFDGPLVIAPAMSSEMWSKEVVQSHVAALERRGAMRVGPVMGPLASGELGMGRMVEANDIVAAVEATERDRDLEGVTVLVTAGPTREPIDTVRFLSNRSSGRMGFSLAAEAAARGARTVLVSGPVALSTPPRVERIDVVTALDMEAAVHQHVRGANLVIMTAAVADFRPRRRSDSKLKKQLGAPELELEPNPDILAGLADVAPQAVRVGFAAETENLSAEARRKLKAKDAHFIVANDVSRDDIGFESLDNEVIVYSRDREPTTIPRQDKRLVAARLIDLFAEALKERHAGAASGRR